MQRAATSSPKLASYGPVVWTRLELIELERRWVGFNVECMARFEDGQGYAPAGSEIAFYCLLFAA